MAGELPAVAIRLRRYFVYRCRNHYIFNVP